LFQLPPRNTRFEPTIADLSGKPRDYSFPERFFIQHLLVIDFPLAGGRLGVTRFDIFYAKAPAGAMIISMKLILYFNNFVAAQEAVHFGQERAVVGYWNGK
jgi:hypothetical protein